jgi:hypothetical protein
LSRIQGIVSIGEEPVYQVEELNDIVFQHNRMFEHATAAFNYTTYDLRRDQDTINTNGQRCDIMVSSNEDIGDDGEAPHPYWYARVLGVFHAKVFHPRSRLPERMEVLWVRWFGRDPEWNSGPKHLRLDRVGFVPEGDPDAFGFVDPAQVIRACHLIPAFSRGMTTSLLGPSSARDSARGDWTNYYVSR